MVTQWLETGILLLLSMTRFSMCHKGVGIFSGQHIIKQSGSTPLLQNSISAAQLAALQAVGKQNVPSWLFDQYSLSNIAANQLLQVGRCRTARFRAAWGKHVLSLHSSVLLFASKNSGKLEKINQDLRQEETIATNFNAKRALSPI